MSDQGMSLPPPPEISKRGKKSEALWLMSFSDMSLVLLCFFVLMISTMKPNKEKFENIKEGMTAKVDQKNKDSLRNLSKKIEKVIEKKNLQKNAQVVYDLEGLHIEFKDGLLFRSGSANTNPKFSKVTRDVMRVIAKMSPKYSMVIEGHTDDTPLKKNGRYRSNWELAASRGFSLMRKFNKMGVDEKKISVVSYAHTRPKIPIETLKGKRLMRARASNRRVVIRIE